ncbi:SapC family protein [Sphingomonas xanthus]|uniref:SapC family protein n=1 Tax=Sphingomonas xanthus TaxID=2594473 RepID=A0A516IPP9_9SPHN|nr:SapC family protein [Sphingomonas xanthus]QDP18826.1 SapC family protein [Sphingomonas xanthus]
MASQAPTLPLLYNALEPLNRNVHGNSKVKRLTGVAEVAKIHAVPLTVDEFSLAQRFYPIVFSAGDDPIPLALMGLHEGTNVFFDETGSLIEPRTYVPAYLRRYPFMLARLREGSDELSLCFDPTSGAISEDNDGEPLFDGEEPSEATKAILQFCEQFEQAGQRTQSFVAEIKESGLLMEGEVAIQPEGAEQPFIYRGFQMVDEEKFRNMRGDELRKINQSGLLPLLMAHLFSLSSIRDLFGRQTEMGVGPAAAQQQAPAPAEA